LDYLTYYIDRRLMACSYATQDDESAVANVSPC